MWQNLINVVRKIDTTVLPRTNHHVHNTGYVIFVTVVSPVLPLFDNTSSDQTDEECDIAQRPEHTRRSPNQPSLWLKTLTPLLDAVRCFLVSLIRASSGLFETMEYAILYVLNESSEGGAKNDPAFITQIFYILRITCIIATSGEVHRK